jgi:hypothetical protein
MRRDQFNRFFYRIKITSFDGQHSATLPEEVLRLLDDVTISEASYSDAQSVPPSLTLTFKETSYLPESAGLTPSNTGHGMITNRPGSVLDLRFDSEKGFTYVSKAEMESGITRSRRTQNAKPQPVIFLFKGGNRIEVEWGLLSPRKSRTSSFTISTISVQGGGSGHGTVSITALDGLMNAQKTHIDRGYVYKDAAGTPRTLKQTLFMVSQQLGCELEFDGAKVDRLPPMTTKFVAKRTQTGGDTAVPDPTAPITHHKGLSLHDFVKDLANEFSSSYEFYVDPITKKQVLKFTYREVRYGDVSHTFTYKSTDDIVLNYKIDSIEGLYNPVTGAASTVDGGDKNQLFYSQKVKHNDVDKVERPLNPEDNDRVKKSIERNYVGYSETVPAKTDDAIDNHVTSLNDKTKYNSSISLTTLGDPSYRPGLVQVNNIGVRFSKKYRMFSVQHKLNNSGYLCTWSGMSHFAAEGGVNADDAAKANTGVHEDIQVKNTQG